MLTGGTEAGISELALRRLRHALSTRSNDEPRAAVL
jgi:hypothetical protein